MITVNDDCPICGCAANRIEIGTTDTYNIRCLRCGEYNIVRTARAIASRGESTEEERLLLSSWIFENQGIEFNSVRIRKFARPLKPGVHARGLKILRELERKNPTLGEDIQLKFWGQILGRRDSIVPVATFREFTDLQQPQLIELLKWFALSWCKNHSELEFLVVDYLTKELEWLERIDGTTFRITTSGWKEIEAQSHKSVESPIAFIAMWFDQQTDGLWLDGIEPALRAAQYEPIRIDQQDFTDRVDDKILATIRESRFMVADYTKHRRAVAYETGFAQGLGIPVIFTCKESDFDDTNFDVSHYPFILWNDDNLETFQEKLEKRIRGVIGAGPNISQADA